MNWATELSRVPDSPDLSPPDHQFFKHLDSVLQGEQFHHQQDAENAFRQFIKSQSTDFCAVGINLFLTGRDALTVMVPILITRPKCIFIYNDLKFVVQNHADFCTSLITRSVLCRALNGSSPDSGGSSSSRCSE